MLCPKNRMKFRDLPWSEDSLLLNGGEKLGAHFSEVFLVLAPRFLGPFRASFSEIYLRLATRLSKSYCS